MDASVNAISCLCVCVLGEIYVSVWREQQQDDARNRWIVGSIWTENKTSAELRVKQTVLDVGDLTVNVRVCV